MVRMLIDGEDARVLGQEGVEVWKETYLTPRYLVSNFGRVLSRTRKGERLMRITARAGQYPGVGVYVEEGGQPQSVLLHRLVLISFDGPSPEGHEARHLNGNGHDARLWNLAWGTRSENMKDLWRTPHGMHGLPEPRIQPARTLTEGQARRTIRMFEAGSVTTQDLAGVLGVSVAVVEALLRGETWPHIPRHKTKIQENFGRKGKASPKALFSDEDLAKALRIYTEEKKSGVWFADFLGIKQVTAHAILSGERWKHVPRPEGFQYPWPDAASCFNERRGARHHAAKHTDEDIEHVFSRIMAGELNSVEAIRDLLKMAKGNVYELLHGQSWAHIQRPEGFESRVAEIAKPPLSKETQAQIIQRYLDGLTKKEVMAEFSIPETKASWYLTKANKIRAAQTPGLTTDIT